MSTKYATSVHSICHFCPLNLPLLSTKHAISVWQDPDWGKMFTGHCREQGSVAQTHSGSSAGVFAALNCLSTGLHVVCLCGCVGVSLLKHSSSHCCTTFGITPLSQRSSRGSVLWRLCTCCKVMPTGVGLSLMKFPLCLICCCACIVYCLLLPGIPRALKRKQCEKTTYTFQHQFNES